MATTFEHDHVECAQIHKLNNYKVREKKKNTKFFLKYGQFIANNQQIFFFNKISFSFKLFVRNGEIF